MGNLNVSKLIEAIDKYYGDGDKQIEKHEAKAITIFHQKLEELKNKGSISEADFKNTVGLYITNTYVETSKKSVKRINEEFMSKVQYAVANGATRGNILQKVVENLGNNVTDINYINLLAKLETILNDVNKQEYKEQGDIRKNRKNLDNYKGLDKDMRQLLEDCVRNELKDVAYHNIEKTVDKSVEKYLKSNPGATLEEARMACAEEFDNIKKDSKKSFLGIKLGYKDEATKEAVKEYEKDVMEKSANTVMFTEISKQDDTKYRKVRSGAKENMENDGTYNSYTRSALKGNSLENRAFGKSSTGKLASQAQANYNKVKEARYQSEEQILKTLGKRDELFERLKGSGLISRTSDGNYDLKALQDILTTEVGLGDHELSRHADIDKRLSEIKNSHGAMVLQQAFGNCTEKDAEALIELCGIPKEKKDYYKATLGAVFGFVVGAVSGAVTEATRGDVNIYTGDKKLESNAEITIENSEDVSFTLPDTGDVSVQKVGLKTIIKINSLVELPGTLITLGKDIGLEALRNSIIPTIAGFAAGLKDSGEVAVTALNPEEADFEAYSKRVQTQAPDYAGLVTLMAACFLKKDGTLDLEKYSKFLNDHASPNGKLNPKELAGTLVALMRDRKPVQPKKVSKGAPAPLPPKSTPHKQICLDTGCDVDVKTTDNFCTHQRNGGDSWKGIVEAYYPELAKTGLWGKDGAIKQFQRALCTDENGVFDADKFRKLINSPDIPEVIYIPRKIGSYNIAGCSDDVSVKAQTQKELGQYDKEKAKDLVKTAGNNNKIYTATDGCSDNEYISTKSAEDAVLKAEGQEHKKYNNRNKYVK